MDDTQRSDATYTANTTDTTDTTDSTDAAASRADSQPDTTADVTTEAAPSTEPPDATPSDATPSDATPSDATPSDPRVVAALERLTSLDDLPVDEHVAVYAAAHRDLRDALAEAASRDTTDQA